MARDIYIVPHTHWDREWYAAFQTFRLKLVDLLDELLELLESDPGYAHFMLDGQMAVVDDYLAIRPENEERLRRLAVSGRLGMGPWYILMDEFLVSGETMVRDLQLGLEKAGNFGGATLVGYLPDMFGHVAQMPQILQQFGLDHAVVWRGVPNAVDRSGFWWEAPDGSTVRAEFLPDGYGNGATLPDDAKELVALVERFEYQHADLLVGPILWMNGTDHLMPQPWLARVVAEANSIDERYRFRVASLGEYVAAAGAATDELPRWKGELRSGGRSNLLMGVASNRVDVKQAAAAAERGLERHAEPLSALFLPADRWPGAFLATAWMEVVRNSAHDSSCACSIDEVCDAVLVRYQEARQIADGLTERAVKAVSSALAAEGTVAVNPTARARSGLVEVRLPGHDPVEGTQVLRLSGGDNVAEGITRADAATLVQAALDNMPQLHDAEVEVGADGTLDIRLAYDPARRGERYAGPARAQVAEAAADEPDGPARLSIVTPTTQKVLAHVADVAGFGWARWEGGPLQVEAVGVTERADGHTYLGNGVVTVAIDPADGTFEVDGHKGLGNLVDDGDVGDTYNYCPPFDDRAVSAPDAVSIRVLERGPLRARVAIDRRYTWPTHAAGPSRTGERSLDTTTLVEVVAGSRLVRLTTELDNTCRDHRLRAWFPLPAPARSSFAECAFGVVERPITAEGGPTEKAMPTYPSRRFVAAGGLTVVHDGLLEYELVDISAPAEGGGEAAHALALTLLRCTGLISQGPMATRPLPAGPVLATPDAQMPGRQVLRYGVQLGDAIADAYAAADEAFVPLLSGRAPGGGSLDDRGQRLSVTGAEVSAVLRESGRLTVRVFNPSSDQTVVRVAGRTGWLVDLRGRPIEPFEETFALAPHKIATAVLDESAERSGQAQRTYAAVVDTLFD